MAAPGRRFSWTRLITNAIPNFACDDINDVDLTPQQADNLLRYQLAVAPYPRCKYLAENGVLCCWHCWRRKSVEESS